MSSITAELLEKYHANECTPEERLLVEQWIARQETVFPEIALPPHIDESALQHRVWKEMKKRTAPSESFVHQPHITRSGGANRWIFRSAVAACLVISLAFIYSLYLQKKEKEQPVTATNLHSYATFEMPKGKHGSIVLPDGTTVTLNAGSSLRYPSHFSQSDRVVQLSGEAFFEVTKDSLRPFSVRTIRNSVKVLGTKFNVKSYPSDRLVTVSVKEGKVRFSDLNNSKRHVILIAGEKAVQEKGKTFNKTHANLSALAAWTQNSLAFDDEPMSGVIKTIERWYDVKVEIRTSMLRGFHYTGFYADPPLEVICKQLAFVLKCNYKIAEQKVIFY